MGPSLSEETGPYLIDTLSAFLISSHQHVSVFNTAKLVSSVSLSLATGKRKVYSHRLNIKFRVICTFL